MLRGLELILLVVCGVRGIEISPRVRMQLLAAVSSIDAPVQVSGAEMETGNRHHRHGRDQEVGGVE